MPLTLHVRFVPTDATLQPTTVVLAGTEAKLGAAAQALDRRAGGIVHKAASAAGFTGKLKASFEVLAPTGIETKRVLVMGTGADPSETDRINLGGAIHAAIAARKATTASLIADGPSASSAAQLAADLAFGAMLRSYSFRTYLTKGRDDDSSNGTGLATLYVHVAKPEQAELAFAAHRAVADGVALARDLVNEPCNVLGPVEFADRIEELADSGLEIEILDADQLTALKMGALLGVAQGSARPARVAIMHWQGAKSKRAKPLCFVGKGVTFDTGGISLKPGAGMEDMKGDMGGAACVTGLMLALAKRRAPVNVVGLVGLVENMPSGTAQRPGDIVTSMSGQTIEIINTDAEGRLVLADVVWYAQERFKPRFIIDLATLTGAIMVALGKEHAGLFANNDKLADEITAAGSATAETVWRMPLTPAYDKLIDSRFADMKNTGGRHGGAITAAQFIQRFIKDTPWAHLDVAGVAMDSNKSDVNTSWGSGWGVRLLDRMIADSYEKAEK
jgi:leucyl aminopeptidase